MYNASGAMKRSRHRMHFIDESTHTADAYEYGPNGEWQLQRRWPWQRHETPEEERSDESPTEPPAEPSKLASQVGHLLTGSGRWRASNPEYEPGSDEPVQYAMNYRWGPYRRHVVAEIVSIYEGGKREKDWSLYTTHNPVTGITMLEQRCATETS